MARGVRAALVLLAAGAGLAACAGPTPRYAISEPGRESIPRGPGVAPGPDAGSGLHGTDRPYQIGGRWYYPKADPDYDQEGLASWYGAAEHNRHTADGEVFDQYGLTGAHRTLPLPSIVEVINLANGRSLRVRLNDRGPFVDGRLIDLSRGAAEQLGFGRQGLARVRVRYISPAPPLAAEGVIQARLSPRRAVIDAPPPPVPDLAAMTAPKAAPMPTPVPAPSLASDAEESGEADYRVLVGAYASRSEATRAATHLGDDVRYLIEPVQRDGATFYRVVLGGFLDEDDALAAQLRFNAAGFPDARVLKPF
jgi:rare lipoprotein A